VGICGAFAKSQVVNAEQLSGLQLNFFCFLFQEWQAAHGISACFSISITFLFVVGGV
jgi:hypothetical protein